MPTYDRQSTRHLHTGSKQWRAIRARVLAGEPLCRMCKAPATDVDHIHRNTADNRLDALMPLCKPCHSHKTAREQAGMGVVYGCDVDGLPLDPDHPWNREKSPVGSS